MLEAQAQSRSLQLELNILRRKTRETVQMDDENERLRSELEASRQQCMELEAKVFAVTLSSSVPPSPSDKMRRMSIEKEGLEADLAKMYEQLQVRV